jgi:hypothetical protein
LDGESGNSWEALLGETPLAKHLMALGRAEPVKNLLYAAVSARFPELLTLAQKQTRYTTDITALYVLFGQVVTAHTEEDARQYLLTIE